LGDKDSDFSLFDAFLTMADGLWPMARFTQGAKLMPFAEASHKPLAIGHSYKNEILLPGRICS
jgi:hypothetical protein